jgi:hypothetical protein
VTGEAIHQLAVADSGCGDIRVRFENLELSVEYEFRASGQDQLGHLRFVGVVAFRFVNELHSVGFASGSYDAVVEISPSPWLEQLRAIEPSGFEQLRDRHHFALLLSSNGYLEVVARELVIDAATLGLLEDESAAAPR